MSVFISYSSKDSQFVDKLALELVREGIKVWIDKWELKVGDSLIDKIQQGIIDSSFLLVVLSENSVVSAWCTKELNAGLMRELDERKVILLPIVIDNCSAPIFLREKKFADFRTDFDVGFKDLIKPLSKLFSEYLGRSKGDNFIMDYALTYGEDGGLFKLDIDAALHYEGRPNGTVLIQVSIVGDQEATNRWRKQVDNGLPHLMKEAIIATISKNDEFASKRILLRDDLPWQEMFHIQDKALQLSFEMVLRARLLGEDNGLDSLINFGNIFKSLDTRKK